jgi:L-alanine-DL-glutamate epimerase-like enolase superfamily enzyme
MTNAQASQPSDFVAYAASFPLAQPFRIAYTVVTSADSVLFRISRGEHVGLGESLPVARYNVSAAGILSELEAHAPDVSAAPFNLRQQVLRYAPATRCGLDIAFHDLLGKMTGVPLFQLFGLAGMPIPPTSMSIPVSDIASMVAQAKLLADVPVIKIKVGTGGEIELLEALRSVYHGAIRIDANEAWSAEEAVRILTELERFDLEFCEQPIPAGHPEQLRFVRERVNLPIVADEDLVVVSDLSALIGCVDGINVKLAKCGGIMAAIEMIAAARALGMKVMIGCTLETSILSTAAAHIAALADWIDIDGPTFLASDPFVGLTYDRGRVTVPSAPGLGVREVAPA